MQDMRMFNVCALLSHNDSSADIIRGGFRGFPNGMCLEDFRTFVLQNVLSKPEGEEGTETRRCTTSKTTIMNLLTDVDAETLRMRSGGASGLQPRFSKQPLFSFSRRKSGKPRSFGSVLMEADENDKLCHLDYLFSLVDSDRDGFITWDDMLQRAVEEATQDITSALQSMHSYSFFRSSTRSRAIKSIHGLPQHKSLFAVVTGSHPLTLMKRSDFSIAKQFTPREVGGAPPTSVEYLPGPDILLSYSRDDATIRGWWNFLSVSRMGVMNPLHLDGIVRRLRLGNSSLPYSFFTAGSNGNIQHWKVPKQRYVCDMVSEHIYKGIHSCESGGIIDFVMTDEWFFSVGFDHRVVSTNVETGGSVVMGQMTETIRFVEYNKPFNCFPCVTYGNELLLWDVRSSSESRSTPLVDDSFKVHRGSVIGLTNAPGLPQVITADNTGRIKIWDLRLLRCVQTLFADGSSESDFSLDMVGKELNGSKNGTSHNSKNFKTGKSRCISSFCYFANTHEIVSSSADALVSLRYDRRSDCTIADADVLYYACFDEQHELIVLQGPTRTSVWDAKGGYRRSLFDRVTQSDIPIGRYEVVAMCVDPIRNRIFYALAEGVIEVRSSKDYVLIDTYSMHNSEIREMCFSYKHNMLVSMAENGVISVRNEKRSVPWTMSISVSKRKLRSLILSDELGFICCCDDHYIYFIDYRQTSLVPFPIEAPFPVHVMAIFGTLPVLALGSKEGQIVLWSLPPAEVSYTMLASINLEGIAKSQGQKPIAQPKKDNEDSSSLGNETTWLPLGLGETKEYKYQEELLPSVAAASVKASSESCDSSLCSLLREICRKESSSLITAIAFDDVLHNLFVADGSGKIFVYSLCPLVQDYGLLPCSFEKRTRYRLRDVPRDSRLSNTPPLAHTITAHHSAANYMTWFPGLRVIISCGGDSNVKLFDVDGREVGQLLMTRLPPRPAFDAVNNDRESRPETGTVVVKEAPYCLPADTGTTKKCVSCALMEERRQEVTAFITEEDNSAAVGVGPLPSINRKQHNRSALRSARKAPCVTLGAFMKAEEEKIPEVVEGDVKPQPVPAATPEITWLAALKRKKWHHAAERSRGTYIHNSDMMTRPAKIVGSLPDSKVESSEDLPNNLRRNANLLENVLKGIDRSVVGLTRTKKPGTAVTPPPGGKTISESGDVGLKKLTLAGIQLSPRPFNSALSPGTKTPRSGYRGKVQPIKMSAREKWEFCTGEPFDAQHNVGEDDVSRQLDELVHMYEKEMHRCFRGGKRHEKIKKNKASFLQDSS
ncbi:WD domain [Trypanosoma brucei equiperdum]|uniref:WD domain n=1 Tax=Trypanosoma brucei equiperdum TaxID=630700 RepID=A0A3L6L5W8_9TRYP|nr:WD domain [Trypanosoma brucei equiperdum]